MFKRRWYDKSDKTQNVLSLLYELDERSRKKISQNIIDIANSIKTIRKEQEILPISIGKTRVLGLYQTNNQRRWYDKNEYLNNAFLTISTLPAEDFNNIMEGILISVCSD